MHTIRRMRFFTWHGRLLSTEATARTSSGQLRMTGGTTNTFGWKYVASGRREFFVPLNLFPSPGPLSASSHHPRGNAPPVAVSMFHLVGSSLCPVRVGVHPGHIFSVRRRRQEHESMRKFPQAVRRARPQELPDEKALEAPTGEGLLLLIGIVLHAMKRKKPGEVGLPPDVVFLCQANGNPRRSCTSSLRSLLRRVATTAFTSARAK